MENITQISQELIENSVQMLPIGTNKNLLELLQNMMSGQFLESRGALFPALAASGQDQAGCQRISNTLRSGVFWIQEIIDAFVRQVKQSGKYESIEHAGYRALVADLTFIKRSGLVDAKGKYYHGGAGKAVGGVGCGLICEVGQVKGSPDRRMVLVREIVTETGLASAGQQIMQSELLTQVAKRLEDNEILIHDAGAKISQLQSHCLPRYLVRVPKYSVFRRNELPAAKSGKGRPSEYGTRIRVTERKYKDKIFKAHKPDQCQTFTKAGRAITVKLWQAVVLPSQKVSQDNPLLNVFVFEDPDFEKPLVIATNVNPLGAETVFDFYLDRWPVEHPPLVAKQLRGMQRQFVFNRVARERLLALSLIAGNMLTWLARLSEAQPTGFWNKKPQQTPGRLRRRLAQLNFSKLTPNNPRILKKSLAPTI